MTNESNKYQSDGRASGDASDLIDYLQAATRDAPSDPVLPAWFDTFLTNVCELSDRNSPAEEQDAIVATLEELSNCALNAIEHCAASAPKGDGND